MPVTLVLLWIVALTLVAAGFLFQMSERAQVRERALKVFYRYLPTPVDNGPSALLRRFEPIINSIKVRLWQAGLQPAQWQVVVVVWLVVLSLLLGFVWGGWKGAVGALFLSLFLAHTLLTLQANRRRSQMVEQLPGFVDQLLRMVNVGSTLEESLVATTRETDYPLKSVFEPVVRQTRLGGSLEEALELASSRYRLVEIGMLTTAVRISRRYGSSVREMLRSVVTMVREQQRARQELRGMTSETRASAWILGALPVLLVLYMLAVNPDYFLMLWDDATGRVLVFVAVGLQLLGVALLWRLLKAV